MRIRIEHILLYILGASALGISAMKGERALEKATAPVPGIETPLVAIPLEKTSTGFEKDVTDEHGKVLSDGSGHAVFHRQRKHKRTGKRQVVHQVKKGLWIGGEK